MAKIDRRHLHPTCIFRRDGVADNERVSAGNARRSEALAFRPGSVGGSSRPEQSGMRGRSRGLAVPRPIGAERS
jgi:hypothetical protein